MYNTIIERIARELCAQDGDDPNRIRRGEAYPGWQAYTWTAIRILGVMREPEDGMVDAGYAAPRDKDGDMAPRAIWEAMIDEALAGTHRPLV